MTAHRHVLSILVEDRFGELARIVGLFAGRGFNIDTLAVNHTLEPGFSRVVLTTRGDDQIIEQITKQVHKLLRVRKVHHLVDAQHIERELVLATVRVQGARQQEDLEGLLKLTGARVVSYSATTFTIELTATPPEVDSFLERLRPLGIKDMVRSAPIALAKPAGSDAESSASEESAA
jgi:acetolactate synthase I/III small subunit